MNRFSLILFLLISATVFAQYSSRDLSTSPYVDGTLLLPDAIDKPPLAIIIAGSGPTDRNGNSQMARNNSLKLLAEGLASKGIAVFRYDKRILKQIKDRTLDESSIRFSQFVEDAQGVVKYFNKANAFSSITVIGHSQGSLVGMLACPQGANGMVSLAGAGEPIDSVILEQLQAQAPGLVEDASLAFSTLRETGSVSGYNPGLESLLRPQIQPFMLSWMVADPTAAISALDIPVLIVTGDKDLNVAVDQAEKLQSAKPNSQLLVIEGMNHVLRKIEGDDYDNGKSYDDPTLPVMPELIDAIAAFVQNLESK